MVWWTTQATEATDAGTKRQAGSSLHNTRKESSWTKVCDLRLVDQPAKTASERWMPSERCLRFEADETMRSPSPATDHCEDDDATKRTWQRHGAPTTCSSS